jgi:hypothetical protein
MIANGNQKTGIKPDNLPSIIFLIEPRNRAQIETASKFPGDRIPGSRPGRRCVQLPRDFNITQPAAHQVVSMCAA